MEAYCKVCFLEFCRFLFSRFVLQYSYFGEPLQRPCGTSCQICVNGPVRLLASNAAKRDALFEQKKSTLLAASLPIAKLPELSRMLAKFLVGAATPGMPNAFGLTQKVIKMHPLFGLFEGFDFLKVLSMSEELMSMKKIKK